MVKLYQKIKDKKFIVNPFNEIKNSYSGYEKISDELFKWVEKKLIYYISNEKMTPNESYNKLINDIDHYYMMDEKDSDFIKFSKSLKYSNSNKLLKDLFYLSTIDFNEVFNEI